MLNDNHLDIAALLFIALPIVYLIYMLIKSMDRDFRLHALIAITSWEAGQLLYRFLEGILI